MKTNYIPVWSRCQPPLSPAHFYTFSVFATEVSPIGRQGRNEGPGLPVRSARDRTYLFDHEIDLVVGQVGVHR